MSGPNDPDYTTLVGPTGIIGADRTSSFTLSRSTDVIVIPISGCATLIINVQGIGSNDLRVQVSVDGTNYSTIRGNDSPLPTANGDYIYDIAGYQFAKFDFILYISGTVTVKWVGSIGTNGQEIFQSTNTKLNNTPWGFFTALPTNGVVVNASRFSFSSLSSVRTEQLLSTAPTYQIAVGPATPGATPTDIVTLSGSASKIIRITKMILSATQTTAGVNNWFVIKRSALNSGGTSSTPTIVPNDSTNPAATAVPLLYSVNPAGLGASVGNIVAQKIFTPVPASAIFVPPSLFDFTNSGVDQGIVLRNASELLALNFNGAALPTGLSISLIIQWQEF